LHGTAPPNTVFLLEAPLIGERGECVLALDRRWPGNMQVLIMHSPALRPQSCSTSPRAPPQPIALAMKPHPPGAFARASHSPG